MRHSVAFPPAARSLVRFAWLILLCGPALALASTCPPPASWQDPTGREWTLPDVISDLATADAVLLGEWHDRLEHHRWQLQVITALHAREPGLAIGLEMLPREAQPALDAWVAGELDLADFLHQSGWERHWGFAAELYLPILHFARMNRIPLQALNVDRALMQRILSEGWEDVPLNERHSIPAPAPALPAYVADLEQVFNSHPSAGIPEAELERFVSGQLVWDRAMAAGIRDALETHPMVVALMGTGHVEFGHGVAHQLRDLGVGDIRSLLPWEYSESCPTPAEGIADLLFGVESGDRFGVPAPLRLGVNIEAAEGGVRILSVAPESVAEAAGLREADLLTHAAERPLVTPTDLIAIVRTQRPGHVLPLQLRRDEVSREVLARFPWTPDATDD